MKQRLLIVDDEPGIVDMMASYFSSQYEVFDRLLRKMKHFKKFSKTARFNPARHQYAGHRRIDPLSENS